MDANDSVPLPTLSALPISTLPPSSSSTSTSSCWTIRTRVEEANRKLESTAQSCVNWGVKHERQIQDFEAELASALSDSRAVHNLLVEALSNIEANRQRVSRSLTHQLPHIHNDLSLTLSSLTSLQSHLPSLHSQVHSIRQAYDSGQHKAQLLTRDLEWKRMPLQEKIFRIAFSRSRRRKGEGSESRLGSGEKGGEEEEVPVKKRDVWLTRIILLLLFLVLCWQVAGALDGAYRAYRHRLVWGDKLIS